MTQSHRSSLDGCLPDCPVCKAETGAVPTVVCCPFCRCEDVCMSVEWEARSLEPQDRENTATLTELQCEGCGRAFWI